MSLKARLTEDMKDAMRAKDKDRLATIRLILAALKQRARALELELRRLSKAHAKAVPVDVQTQPSQKLRFTAKGLASQRRRLGLSASDVGLLVGASGQSIYNWEEGKAHPRAKHLPAIAALRTMGKKEASARLASLR
mgnify:CR=1 FL=1